MRRLGFALVVLLAACEAAGEPSESSTGGGGSSSGSGTSTSSSTSSSDAAGETAPAGPGLCRRQCTLPADCCGGLDPCPGQEFPANVGCEANVCVPATCTSAKQCDAVIPGSTCETVDGSRQCVVLCEDDGPCAALGAEFTCGTPTDAGDLYCNRLCTTGAVVCGAATCDEATGRCVCESDAQCVNGFRCV